MLKFIVTGTGRSGTVYMARVLTNLGIPCGHESIFNQEREKNILQRFYGFMKPTMSKCSHNPPKHGWLDLSNIQADSSYMAVPYLNYEDVNKIPVVHVVRNPFAVISSFILDFGYFQDKKDNVFNQGKWEEWIFSHTPGLNSIINPIERVCMHYLNWNECIEKCKENRPYHFQKVEGLFDDNFFKFLGIPTTTIEFKNKRINSKKKRDRDLTAQDIPTGSIKDKFLGIVDRYGYNIKLFS